MTVRMLLHLVAIVVLVTVAAVTWVLDKNASAVLFGIAALTSIHLFRQAYPEIFKSNGRR